VGFRGNEIGFCFQGRLCWVGFADPLYQSRPGLAGRSASQAVPATAVRLGTPVPWRSRPRSAARNNMVRRGTMSLLSGWGCMRKPKKSHQPSSKKQTSSKRRTRRLATRRSSTSRSRTRPHNTLRKRAAAQRAAAPTISQKVQEHSVAQADLLNRPSEVVRKISDSGTATLGLTEVDHRESVGNRTGVSDPHRRFVPSSGFTGGVSAIASANAISMEWFNLMLRCTERYLDAIQIFIRCRTPGELIIAHAKLLHGNLNDAFEGAKRVLRQTRR
jgi:hypothetical protein